jgi:Tfp pilus assembly protein PilF
MFSIVGLEVKKTRADTFMSAAKARTQVSTTTKSVSLLVLLLVLLVSAARSGLSSLMTSYAAITSQVSPASTAVLVDANNPDAHYVRGTILEATDLPAAVGEYFQAARARPDDYVLWLSLARARELNGETEGAVAAARQAIPLAPDYAEPHYQLGNILLRAGQRDEAFKELRRAGDGDPTLLPGIISLAWRISNRDLKYVETALGPGTPQLYLALAQYFRQQEEAEAATTMYLAAGKIADENRRSYIGELISAKRFKEAARLWAIDWPEGEQAGVIFDPGFERESGLKDKGFGWTVGGKEKGFRLSLDSNQPREGRSSLRVDFEGDSDPGSAVIYQWVMVEPGARYQLSFAVRTENLVSGGLPLIAVLDGLTYQVLSQSEQLPQTTNGWREYKVDFQPGPSASTVQIAVRRQPCAVLPCPIFGRLWLDNISLKKS